MIYRHRKGTTAQWASPTQGALKDGEIGVNVTTGEVKVGDGATAFASLPEWAIIARKSDITAAINALIGSAPGALNTLDELAAALGDDANFAASITTLLAGKAPLDSPTFTGVVAGITKAMVGLGNVDNTSDATKNLVVANIRTASYTLVLSDAAKVIEMNVATANTLTVPLNSSVAFPIGTVLEVHQYGAGQTTIAATGGVTIRTDGGLKIAAQYGSAALRKRATDEWVATGNLTT